MPRLKKSLWLLLLMIVSVILHNTIYVVFKFEEPVFFTLTFVLFVIFLIFNVVSFVKSIISKFKS